jgi:AAA domain (dynein-related subfamily)
MHGRLERMEDQGSAVEALGTAIVARVPVLLWGAPGTGKTSVIRAMADLAGWPCETVIASIREPSDFAGLPIVDNGPGDGSSHVSFAPPAWARSLARAGTGLVFFDEVSTAPPAVQAALLRVVLERTVGDLTLPDSVSVVAAANPAEQAADGWELSPPLANRFCHLDWPVDARTVAAGFSGGWPDPEPPALPKHWERRIGIFRSWIAGFLTVRPMLALAVPEDAAGAGRAWPSPRTWDMVARLQTAADAGEVGELATSLLVRGCVGPGPGVEYLTWLEEADLPDPESILADPDSFTLPERGDRAYAALTSVAAAVAADASPERWERGWRAFGRAAGSAPDVAAAAARTLARCRPPGAAIPDEVKAFTPLLRDAGLLG